MLPSAKKKRVKKTSAFSSMDKSELAAKLRQWAVEEMCFVPQGRHVNSRIPDVRDFEMLCRGSLVDIWAHVVQHVRSAQTVQKVSGNLKLVSMFRNKRKMMKGVLEEDNKHEKIMKKNAELRSQILQVEKDLNLIGQEVLKAESSLAKAFKKTSDQEKRCALLSSYSERCIKRSKIFDEFRRRLEARIHHHKEKRTKTESENIYFVQKPIVSDFVVTSTEQRNSVGLESACTRNVRETCEAVGSFLHHLHNAYVIEESPTRSYSDKTKAQLWTSVENMLSQHSAKEIYESLAKTVLDSATNLQELTARIDVRKEAEELKFRYENSGHFSDASVPPPLLKSVHQLIEEGQASHFQRFLEAEKAKNESFKGQNTLAEFQENMENKQKSVYADNKEVLTLARSLYRTELECVVAKASLEFIEKEIEKLTKVRSNKQAQVDTLYAKYKQIQDFEKFVQTKQSMIRKLIKHNSDAKIRLNQQQNQTNKYIQERVCAHEPFITATMSSTSNNVSRESSLFVSMPLQRIHFSSVEGGGRIPICDLSINAIEWSVQNNGIMMNNLGFPMYQSLDCLLQKVNEIQNEIITEQQLSHSKNSIIDSLCNKQGSSLDDNYVQDLKKAVEDHNASETRHVLPKIQESFSKGTKALSEYILTKDAVSSWWEQPAQFLAPWITIDGMNMRQWKDQWTVIVTRLRRAQMKQ